MLWLPRDVCVILGQQHNVVLLLFPRMPYLPLALIPITVVLIITLGFKCRRLVINYKHSVGDFLKQTGFHLQIKLLDYIKVGQLLPLNSM